MSIRLNPKVRKSQVLDAAMIVAEKKGYMQMERSDVAAQAKLSGARISQLFNTMPQLRRAVMRHAVKTEHHRIIAQGLAVRDKQALKAPLEVQKAAMAAII